MNKLSKILLCIIIILTIALGISTFSYLKMKESAKHNLKLYLESQEKITQIMEDNK